MLATRQQIYEQDARQTYNPVSALTGLASAPSTPLGTIAETPDGRVFQFSLAGATSLLAGKLTTGPATTANHVTQTGVATVVGDHKVTYTTGATTAVVDFYKGGYFAVNVGPGQNLYKIIGHTAITAANSYAVTVTLGDDGIDVATTTSSKFSLYPNPFNLTVITTSSAAQPCTGTPNVPVTAGYNYWSQVGGYATVLNDGTAAITKNAGAIVSPNTDGAATIEAAGTVTQRIGYAPELTVVNTYLPLVLQIKG